MLLLVLAVRGAVAVLVLTTLVGGVPRVAQGALAATLGLWSAVMVAPDGLEIGALDVALLAAAREAVIGASLGVAAAVPLLAIGAAGTLVDAAGRGARRGPYARLFGVLAAAVFVGIDGHVAAIRAIVESHVAAPALGATQPRVVAAIAALLPSAVRLAVPWLVTAAVVEIAVGAGARVAARAGAHAPLSSAVPAALAMMTAALVSTLAVAIAHMF